MTVRPARIAESDDVARLFRLVREECLPYLPRLHTPEEDHVFFRDRVFANDTMWVAPRSGDIVGLCAFRAGWVDHLYVHPAEHGRGIGSALLAQAMAAHPRLQLWVFQKNANAIRFYETKGFVLVRKTDGCDNEEREPDALYAWAR